MFTPASHFMGKITIFCTFVCWRKEFRGTHACVHINRHRGREISPASKLTSHGIPTSNICRQSDLRAKCDPWALTANRPSKSVARFDMSGSWLPSYSFSIELLVKQARTRAAAAVVDIWKGNHPVVAPVQVASLVFCGVHL